MGVPPIQIGKLQRYATDVAFAEGWQFFTAGAPTGKSVGIVGGGPAGLAAAHRLRRFGHAVTIYEKRGVLGGLNTTGVAPYKMRADKSAEEVDWVLAIGGIDIKTGITLPEDLSFADIEATHDAVFIGFGLGADSTLNVPGHDLQGVIGAVDLIEQFKLGSVDLSMVQTAAVIGGGNTAIDVVRELIGLGVPNVRMVYRGVEASMSGYLHEWAAAKVDGALADWKTQPVGYEGSGSVAGVRCVKMSDAKRPIEGTEHTIPADLVVLAVGQSKLGSLLADLDGIEIEWGRVVTDDQGATGRAGWYAGGDCRNGGKEVVNAVAEGRDAAEAMHVYLTGGN
jgi:glutamate synthase (NADPH/NADH) small chain